MLDLLAHGAAVYVAMRGVPTVRILEAVEHKAKPQGTTHIVVVQPRSLADMLVRTIRMAPEEVRWRTERVRRSTAVAVVDGSIQSGHRGSP
jgi:hypothetical protein